MNSTKWSTHTIQDNGDTLLISELSILRSAAGFYVGYLCKTIKCGKKNERPGLIEPYKRLSGYMSQEDAVESLKKTTVV